MADATPDPCPLCGGPLGTLTCAGEEPTSTHSTDDRMCERCGRIPPKPASAAAPPAASPFVHTRPPGTVAPAPPGGVPCLPCIFCHGPTTTLTDPNGFEYDQCVVCLRRTGHYASHRTGPGTALMVAPTPREPGAAFLADVTCWGGPMDGARVSWGADRVYCYRSAVTGHWMTSVARLGVATHCYTYDKPKNRYGWMVIS
jgi:hypothetical protein